MSKAGLGAQIYLPAVALADTKQAGHQTDYSTHGQALIKEEWWMLKASSFANISNRRHIETCTKVPKKTI